MKDPLKKQRLIEYLKLGNIRATSAEWVKANLRYVGEAVHLRAAVASLPISAEEKRTALTELAIQAGPLHRVWVEGDGYYTLRKIDGEYEVYHYRDYRETFSKVEIDESFWSDAWIDEFRWIVVVDDLTNLLRREFMRVSFLREDVEKSFEGLTNKRKRGPKQRHFFDIEVADYARSLLPLNLRRSAWESRIKERYPNLPEKTLFGELYGWIWTDDHESRKSRI